MTLRPGLILAAAFLCVYGALALTVDFPRARTGLQSDEATYYMMGLSLVHDGDLTYRREDLVRVWKEFPAGPAGVFLKKGRKIGGAPDPEPAPATSTASRSSIRCSRRRSSCSSAPTGSSCSTRCCWRWCCCAAICSSRALRSWPSAILPPAFVMASVVPVYFVRIMPEVFNFSLACWRISAGSIKRWRCRRARRAGRSGCSRGASDVAVRRAAGHRDVLEADQRPAVRRACALVDFRLWADASA